MPANYPESYHARPELEPVSAGEFAECLGGVMDTLVAFQQVDVPEVLDGDLVAQYGVTIHREVTICPFKPMDGVRPLGPRHWLTIQEVGEPSVNNHVRRTWRVFDGTPILGGRGWSVPADGWIGPEEDAATAWGGPAHGPVRPAEDFSDPQMLIRGALKHGYIVEPNEARRERLSAEAAHIIKWQPQAEVLNTLADNDYISHRIASASNDRSSLVLVLGAISRSIAARDGAVPGANLPSPDHMPDVQFNY